MNINTVDLNLLRPLMALLRERNVSTAAKSVGLTQPAMSNALKRLRGHFADDLLVRSGSEMVLTPRAERLKAPAQNLLEQLEGLFEHTTFDPSQGEHHIYLDSSDYASFIVAPHLMQSVRQRYPHVHCHLNPWGESSLGDKLSSGAIDFCLGTGLRTSLPERLYAKTLFQDRFACAVSQNYAPFSQAPSLEQYCQARHMKVTPYGLGIDRVDKALEEMDFSRKIEATMPHFFVAIHSLEQTPLVLTLPEKILQKMARTASIAVYPLPFDLGPFDVSLIWHERSKNSARHQWIKQELYQLAPLVD